MARNIERTVATTRYEEEGIKASVIPGSSGMGWLVYVDGGLHSGPWAARPNAERAAAKALDTRVDAKRAAVAAAKPVQDEPDHTMHRNGSTTVYMNADKHGIAFQTHVGGKWQVLINGKIRVVDYVDRVVAEMVAKTAVMPYKLADPVTSYWFDYTRGTSSGSSQRHQSKAVRDEKAQEFAAGGYRVILKEATGRETGVLEP